MRNTITFFLLLFSFIELRAYNIQTIKSGSLHEAFALQECDDIVMRSFAKQPPAPITEEVPYSESEDFIWIPGYWAWSEERQDYIWVSGVLRRPPLGHKWIAGHWKHYPQGWVWLSGFWSRIPEGQLQYLSQPPPDPLNEKAPNLSPPLNGYFWVPGYWEWVDEEQDFKWFAGRWEVFSQHVVYMPTHYLWRENGYLLVPGYWDWSIERRGVAFYPVAIAQEDRDIIVLEPIEIKNRSLALEMLYPNLPNYPTLFRTHFYYHPDLWFARGIVPPWWEWVEWWTLPEQQSWALWWWWTHPGYPAPSWLDSKLAKVFTAPSDLIIEIVKGATPPPTVTANGVVGSSELIQAIKIATGKNNPILPNDAKSLKNIKVTKSKGAKGKKGATLRPNGEEKPDRIPSKPCPTLHHMELKIPPGRVKVPTLPQLDQSVITMITGATHTPYYLSQVSPASPDSSPPPPASVEGQQHLYDREGDRRSTRGDRPSNFTPTPPYRNDPVESQSTEEINESGKVENLDDRPDNTYGIPENTYGKPENIYNPPEKQEKTPTINQTPQDIYNRNKNTDRMPIQGDRPMYAKPEPPKQTQHLDYLMNNPQPQENPYEAPSVHPLPGNESTLHNY